MADKFKEVLGKSVRRHAGLVLALLLIIAIIYLIYRFHRLALFLVLKKLMDARGSLGGMK